MITIRQYLRKPGRLQIWNKIFLITIRQYLRKPGRLQIWNKIFLITIRQYLRKPGRLQIWNKIFLITIRQYLRKPGRLQIWNKIFLITIRQYLRKPGGIMWGIQESRSQPISKLRSVICGFLLGGYVSSDYVRHIYWKFWCISLCSCDWGNTYLLKIMMYFLVFKFKLNEFKSS